MKLNNSTITGSTPEAVAFALLEIIACAEGYNLGALAASGEKVASRQWLLDTFRECHKAVFER